MLPSLAIQGALLRGSCSTSSSNVPLLGRLLGHCCRSNGINHLLFCTMSRPSRVALNQADLPKPRACTEKTVFTTQVSVAAVLLRALCLLLNTCTDSSTWSNTRVYQIMIGKQAYCKLAFSPAPEPQCHACYACFAQVHMEGNQAFVSGFKIVPAGALQEDACWLLTLQMGGGPGLLALLMNA